MLGRAVVRGLAADARSLSFRPLTLRLREAAPRTSTAPLIITFASPSASSKPLAACACRSYATSQPTRRKPASRAGAKAKPKKKATKKPAKKKPAKKAKKKPATKKPKAPQTELERMRAKVRDLRKKALLQTPKQLPQTAYLVFVTERATKGQSAAVQASQNSAEFRNLSASQQEHLQNVAQQNRRANEKTVKDWIESHTADEIRIANNARRQLNNIAKEPRPAGAARALVSHGYNYLSDARRPVRFDTAYIAFSRDRWASGDFNGMSVGDAGKRIGQEWKSLDSSQQKRYFDAAEAERAKWSQEMNRLYSTSSGKS